MISLPLFKASMKKTLKLLLGFSLVMVFYLLTTAYMYDPSGESDPFSALPEGMREALGLLDGPQTIEGFLSTGFYGVTFLVFMAIFCLIVANQLMASLVDRGPMAYLLATPVSRGRVARTQAAVLLVSLLVIAIVLTAAGLLGIPGVTGGAAVDVSVFVQVNLIAFLMFFVVSGYAFLFSSLFNESKQALTASGGLTLFMYLCGILANSSAELNWLKNLSLFSVFQPLSIVQGETPVGLLSALLVVTGAALYAISFTAFRRRDLPL
ncbi:ABC transporter permease subunit [Paenibacillus tarimensis]|uniref:ABC transporter permease subunit n=1 Tax=Paenibacillus tarimensis TaxID=416012 RepID=UPI001F2E7108|nr:ABC transporter permease subunit [Paenibacillus tarimensis]MCF2944379.1 ABC transporter permease [Paenibacillus tarimensis]